MRPFDIIVAATAGQMGIGREGGLPWRLRTDMAFFKRCTLETGSQLEGAQNAVIMGRKTYESIPPKFRPLNGRLNVVVSRNPDCRANLDLPDEVLVASSLDDALAQVHKAATPVPVSNVFVIGGGSIYEEAVQSPACARVLLTTVHASKELEESCDVFFPKLDPAKFTLTSTSAPVREGDSTFSFAVYEQVQASEGAAAASASGGADEAMASSSCSSSSSSSSSAVGESAASPVVIASDGAAQPPTPPSARPGDDLLDLLLSGADVPPLASGSEEAAAAAAPPPPARAGVGPAVFPAPSPGASMAAAMTQHPEMQYLNLIRDIMENGVVRGDRTGTGTVSKFGVQMRFSLRGAEFPLLTTKRVFWRGVAEELLWFVAGSTNAKLLQDKNIKIWDGNASREFLDGRGLQHREVGDLGPVYGFQWRHFGVSHSCGQPKALRIYCPFVFLQNEFVAHLVHFLSFSWQATYSDMHADYSGQGVDQLAKVIETIKTNPTDRRILLSAWNPSDLDAMALPPCHMFCQFYVAGGELSCQMYQRSADMGLGVPFNIASYALLTRMVAQVCGLKAGDFVHTIGDAHVYLNHCDALKEQLSRAPRPFPTLKINPAKGAGSSIDGFEFSDFTVEGYKPHGTIKMKMAV